MELNSTDFPKVRGKVIFGQRLAQYTWFRVGGIADVFFLPADFEDLQYFVQKLNSNIPLYVIGACSNVIIRDGGIEGVVVRLAGKYWGDVRLNDNVDITARAGALDARIASFASSKGVAGLEFLSGIPGTIGAAVHTNAGCYGREFKDVVTEIRALDRSGETMIFRRNSDSALTRELELFYRASNFPENLIVYEVLLKGSGREDPQKLEDSIVALKERREKSQPIREKTGGSTFANPDEGGHAWELIEQAGCRGLQIGGAKVSEKHCNFITNTGVASARDIEELGTLVKQTVFEKTGVSLRWEIRRTGRDSS